MEKKMKKAKRKPRKLDEREIKEVLKLYNSGKTIREIALIFDINRNHITNYLQKQGIQTKKLANLPSIGDKFFRLTLIDHPFTRITKKKNGRPQKVWVGKFKCDCGRETTTRIQGVISKNIKSCGCYNREAARARLTGQTMSRTHNLTRTTVYRKWVNIKLKAKRENKSVEERLAKSFEYFYEWTKQQNYDDSKVVRLINPNGHYSLNNLKFITKQEYKQIMALATSKRQSGRSITEKQKEKTRKTCLKKYGAESPLSSPIIQEKIRQIFLEKYGTENPATLESVKEKARQTCLKKYGETHFAKTPEGRLLGKRSTIKSGQATVYQGKMTDELASEVGISRSGMNARIRKYGIEVAVSTEKFETVIEKAIETILNKNKIIFEKQTRIDKYFADFLLPNDKLIIEADGLYWHSDAVNEDNFYHKKKMDIYAANGYRSLFFRENEIEKKIEVIESIILNKIGRSDRIYARNCQILEEKDIKFFEKNHLMGGGSGQTIFLINNREKVAGIRIVNKANYIDINRFCTKLKTNVVGGFSKLITYIQRKYNKKIKTFIDRRYGDGQYLEKLGFKKVNEDLSFMWTKDEKAFHRMKFKKNSGYEHKYFKIWDCGQARYETL